MPSPFFRPSFRLKLVAVIALTTLAGIGVASVLSLVHTVATARMGVSQERSARADLLVATVRPFLIKRDVAAIDEVLDALETDPEVLIASVYDHAGRIVASRTDEESGAGLSLDEASSVGRTWFAWDPRDTFREVIEDGHRAGAVHIRVAPGALAGVFESELKPVGFAAASGLLAALVLLGRARKVVTQPIQNVAGTARAVLEADDFTVRAPEVGRDEVGELARAFNKVLDRVEAHERKLRQARDAAEAANRAKSSFLVTMSHELRTPLNGIIGYSEMLTEEATDRGRDDLIPDLERIRHAAGDLLGLISNVLDLSKIEAGRVDLIIEEFELPALLERVVDGIRPIAAVNGNHVHVDLSPQLVNFKMRGDSTKVAQCVRNLLANACKFTERGTVQLVARRQGETIVLRVSDTGVGMAPEQVERVFDEFFQVEPTMSREFGGSGLGLAICRRLCRRMGGEVTAASRPGQGSTFTLTLPIVPPSEVMEPPDRAVKLAS